MAHAITLDAPLLRITVTPTDVNGLQQTSQVMIDKILTVKNDEIGPTFGSLNPDLLVEIERCLAVFLGVAK